MTVSEFNIKWKYLLTTGFYGLAIEDPTVITFLDNIFEDLSKIPEFEYQQIKLKFGHVSFYSTGLSQTMVNLISSHLSHILTLK